jgi:hypothetical protein
MKFAKYSALLMLTSSLLVGVPAHGETAQAHGAGGNQGGRAMGHMAGKAAANTNAQWSADPERGWIRAEERKGMKNPRSSRSTERTQGKAKQDDKGKKF